MKHYRLKIFFAYLFSFLLSIAPLLLCFVFRMDIYIKAPSDALKLSLGGLMIVFFLVLKVLGKLKIASRVVFFAVVFVLTYLMKSVLQDLILLSGMALVGEALDAFIMQPIIRSMKEKALIGKTADKTAEAVEKAMSKYFEGRV